MNAPCISVSELLEKYFDREVTDGERSLVEEHAKGCASCRDELTSLKGLQKFVKSRAEKALRKERFEGVWNRIEENRPEEKAAFRGSVKEWINPLRFFQRKVWVPAAAATVIILAGFLVWPTKSDLTITSVAGPSIGEICQKIPIAATVKNLGKKSGAFKVTFYLSTDPTITPEDTPIGSIHLNALHNGAQRTLTADRATIPCTLTPGFYYIGAIADSDNRVIESNEKNNSLKGNPIYISMADSPS
jgi:hypothetical protein